MNLIFLAKDPVFAPSSYNINGSVINGIDVSLFTPGSEFVFSEQAQRAFIFSMYWEDGELNVVLSQPAHTADIAWAARSAGVINAASYDVNERYIKATNPNAVDMIERGEAEYYRDDKGSWTVRMVEDSQQEPTQ